MSSYSISNEMFKIKFINFLQILQSQPGYESLVPEKTLKIIEPHWYRFAIDFMKLYTSTLWAEVLNKADYNSTFSGFNATQLENSIDYGTPHYLSLVLFGEAENHFTGDIPTKQIQFVGNIFNMIVCIFGNFGQNVSYKDTTPEILYRCQTHDFDLKQNGDEYIVQNLLSTSIEILPHFCHDTGFYNHNPCYVLRINKSNIDISVYHLPIDGSPFSSKFSHENEILFQKNIKLTCLSRTSSYVMGKHIVYIDVSLSSSQTQHPTLPTPAPVFSPTPTPSPVFSPTPTPAQWIEHICKGRVFYRKLKDDSSVTTEEPPEGILSTKVENGPENEEWFDNLYKIAVTKGSDGHGFGVSKPGFGSMTAPGFGTSGFGSSGPGFGSFGTSGFGSFGPGFGTSAPSSFASTHDDDHLLFSTKYYGSSGPPKVGEGLKPPTKKKYGGGKNRTRKTKKNVKKSKLKTFITNSKKKNQKKHTKTTKTKKTQK